MSRWSSGILGLWARWSKWSLLSRSIPGIYERFIESSKERAKGQGYRGARWGKMSDPTGRSVPREINSLLIWQPPHPMYFAELEWRNTKIEETLRKWDEILTESAEWMGGFCVVEYEYRYLPLLLVFSILFLYLSQPFETSSTSKYSWGIKDQCLK